MSTTVAAREVVGVVSKQYSGVVHRWVGRGTVAGQMGRGYWSTAGSEVGYQGMSWVPVHPDSSLVAQELGKVGWGSLLVDHDWNIPWGSDCLCTGTAGRRVGSYIGTEGRRVGTLGI